MASFEIEGTISKKMPVFTGSSARGPFVKQDFVISYQDGSYPANISFTAFGQDKVDELSKFNENDSVKVSFNIRGREYNGRWYTSIRGWKAEKTTGAPAQQGAAPARSDNAPEAPSADFKKPSSDDDLPF